MRRDVPVAMVLGAIIATAALAYFFASPSKAALLVLLAVEIGAGREASIPAGIAAGLDWREAALAASLIELTSLFLLFPVLVALAAGLHRVRWLEGALARAQDYARRDAAAGAPFTSRLVATLLRRDVDVFALGALTLAPFLPVGALTSALIGEMLRLPSRYLLPTLAAALVLANVVTAYATARLISFFPDPRVVAALMATAVLVTAGIAWLVHRRRIASREDAEIAAPSRSR